LMLSSGRTPSEHVAFGSCLSRSARFHVTILPGTAWIDVERLDLSLLQPVSQEVGNKLRAIVRSDVTRRSMLADELLHHLAHLLRSNVAIHMQRVGLAREFIHYAQHPVIASFHRPIMDEVPAPDMSPVGSLLRVATGGAPGPALLLAGRRHRPALLAAHLSHSCVTHAMSLPANQPANLVGSKFWVLAAEIYDALIHHLLAQAGILRTVTIGRAVQFEHPADLALAAAFNGNSLTRQLPAVRRAYSFFSIVSCRTLMPSMASAYIFLSSVFSFSRAFSRFAAASSI